jgi:hypothetical protein
MRETAERSTPRQPLQVPLRFRVLDEESSNAGETFSETSNISQAGLFMYTHLRLKLGTPLSLSLRIPTSLSGSGRYYFHCRGHVVHEQKLPGGHQGYGVKFDQVLSAHQTSRQSRP